MVIAKRSSYYPTLETDEVNRLVERFITRAHAIFWVRTTILLLSTLFLLNLHVTPLSGLWIFFLLAGASLAYHQAAHPKYARWIHFSTLLFDLGWFLYLIVNSGGIGSPLMAILALYTLLFTLLFHNALVSLDPLLLLPLTVLFHSIWFGSPVLKLEVSLLCFYTFLSSAIASLTNYTLSQEEHQSREVFRLDRKLKELAVLEERNRLSRELHDGIGTSLSGLIIQSEYLLSKDSLPKEFQGDIKEMKMTAEEAMDEVRRTLSMMKNEFDIVPQLQNGCNTFSSRYKIPVHLKIQGTPGVISDEQQLTLFRILQECLANVVKHAQAKKIDILLIFEKNRFIMNIEDDGIGFDTGEIPKNHYGLLNMKERAKKIGGQITVQSSKDRGTKICLLVENTQNFS